MKVFSSSVKFSLFIFSLFIVNQSIAQNGNSGNSNGQGVTQWKTNGNTIDTNQFVGTTNNKPLIFKTNNIESFRVAFDGNVGLGTTMPETKLDVQGETTLRGDIKLPNIGVLNNPNYDIIFRDGTGTLKMGGIDQMAAMLYEVKQCSPDPISNPVWANGENKIFVNCPQVNVGINTTTPRVNLDVMGTSYSHRLALSTDPLAINEKLKIGGYSPSINANLFVIHNAANELFSFSNQGVMNLNGQFLITSYNSTPLIIQSSTEKLLQLESDGLLRSRRIKIDQDSWSDFVFDDGYDLMQLDSLASYIVENKHLPDVPTTAEVNEVGVDLAEMNALLLKKIEELVLYTIQQQKEIEELKKRVGGIEIGSN